MDPPIANEPNARIHAGDVGRPHKCGAAFNLGRGYQQV